MDLLTMFLGSGAAEAAARALAATFSYEGSGPCLRRIAAASPAEVAAVPGIGPARAARLFAAVDLARRLDEEGRPERGRARTPRDVYEHFRFRLRDLRQEEFHVLLLNSQNEVLRDLMVTRGTLERRVSGFEVCSSRGREVAFPEVSHAWCLLCRSTRPCAGRLCGGRGRTSGDRPPLSDQ